MSAADVAVLPDLLDASRLVAAGVDLDAEALTDGTLSWSWRGYAAAADRVAHALVELGVVPGDRVGIRLPKTAWSFVVVHGVLRAGAVAVPVDPLAPPAHAIEVLGDAAVSALVTDHRLRGAEDVVSASGSPILVGEAGAEWAERVAGATRWVAVDVTSADPTPAVADDRVVRPDDDAYIVYTSGSTGRPKGIVHTHASALAGAAVVVVPDVVLRFPASVVDLLDRQRTSIWYTVPHVLRQLVERGALAERDWSRVRLVKYGGESFPPERLADLMRSLPAATVSNVYGPAEVNQCTAYDLAVPPADAGPVPIGDAWPAAEVVLVDPHDVGVEVRSGIGELVVASPTMMRGYWNREGLTAGRIVTRPGSDRRWYRTGDLVERGADGRLRFVGRVDNQVKVRGQRVELEAVDAALERAPGVAAGVAVVDRSDPAGDVVVAVVVASEDPPAPTAARSILAAVSARVPAAAAPARVVFVPSLPLTTSGKVDRGAAASLLDTA